MDERISTQNEYSETEKPSCDSCFVAWALATQQRIWDGKAERKVGKDDCLCEKKGWPSADKDCQGQTTSDSLADVGGAN